MEEEKRQPQQSQTARSAAYEKPGKSENGDALACAVCRWALVVSFLPGALYSRMLMSTFTAEDSDFFTGFTRHWAGHTFYLYPVAGVFTLLFVAVVLLFCRYYRSPKPTASEQPVYPLRKPAFLRESLLWLAVLLAAGASMTFDLQGALYGFPVLIIWHGAAVLWVACRTGQLTDNAVGAFAAPDWLRCMGKGFSGFFCWPEALIRLIAEHPEKKQDAQGTHKKKDAQRLFTFFWFAGAAVLLLIALALLSAADAGFARALEGLKFWENINFDFSRLVTNIIFGVIFGAFFYGLTVVGTLDLQKSPRIPLAQRYAQAQRLRRVQAGPIIGVLYLFSGVYALFTALQLRYLFGALAGRLPQGFTVAGYARQGFFQLCWVMLCNLTLLFLVWLFAKETPRAGALRLAAAVLLALSLLLWLTAALKLGLYIGIYGFTPKRLQAVWALLVLACAAGCTLRGLYAPCKVVRPVLLTAGALLLPLLLWP